MEVKLLNSSGEDICNKAALITTGEENKDVLKKVISYGHTSVAEHATFTFLIKDISRACSHQLVRHRLASYSQQSQRYTEQEEFGYVIPKSIEQDEELLKIYKKTMEDINKSYKELRKTIAPEDARYVLPNATKTSLIMTMNARELLHFLELRCCNRAQWEIRELAWGIRSILIQEAPRIFFDSGPVCMREECKEGKSCGACLTIRVYSNNKKLTTEEKIEIIRDFCGR